MSNKILESEPVPELLASQWLTEKEVALLTRLSLSTLRAHRFAGRGLPYAKLGRMVRYSATEVERYMASRQVFPRNCQTLAEEAPNMKRIDKPELKTI